MLCRSIPAWISCAFCLPALLGAGPLATRVWAQADPGLSSQEILTASPDSALTAALEKLPGETLSLSEAVDRAAAQATEAKVAEARLAAAGQIVRREKGYFDPEIFGSADWSGADTPSASLFAGADVLVTENSHYEAGARMRLPLGTELSASLNSLRLSSNSAFAALDPEYQAYG